MKQSLAITVILWLIGSALGAQATRRTRDSAAHDSAFRAMQERGKLAMGVDQYTSTHHFDALANGGRIELQRDVSDSVSVARRRAISPRLSWYISVRYRAPESWPQSAPSSATTPAICQEALSCASPPVTTKPVAPSMNSWHSSAASIMRAARNETGCR